MDGVLEGAAALCACKLACTLPFLPSLTECNSPVSFCCCCLLVLTDILITVFMCVLHIFDTWVTDLTPLSDVIALRFLLFQSHTYGAALLLSTPLIAVEILTGQMWTCVTVGQTVWSHDVEGAAATEKEEEEEEEQEDSHNLCKSNDMSHVVGYICCLSVWVAVALNVRWHWILQEDMTSTCLLTTNSLIRCLPNLLSPIPSSVNPCWGMTFLCLLLLFLTTSTVLHRQHYGSVHMEEKHPRKRRINKNNDSCWQDHVLAQSAAPPSMPGMSVPVSESESAQSVDPEKTESSCTVTRTYSRNILQMSTHHHGDLVLISYRSQLGWKHWRFPYLWVNVMMVLVFVLSIFVLPLNLSVNIILFRSIETLLQLCIRSFINSSSSITSNTSALHKVIHV